MLFSEVVCLSLKVKNVDDTLYQLFMSLKFQSFKNV